jgi:hypothetical protein
MKRLDRTQIYIDLARLSLELGNNQTATKNLTLAVVSNPNSPLIEVAKEKLAQLAKVRSDLYLKEMESLMTLCGQASNAVELGTLEVLANGQVIAHE